MVTRSALEFGLDFAFSSQQGVVVFAVLARLGWSSRLSSKDFFRADCSAQQVGAMSFGFGLGLSARLSSDSGFGFGLWFGFDIWRSVPSSCSQQSMRPINMSVAVK